MSRIPPEDWRNTINSSVSIGTWVQENQHHNFQVRLAPVRCRSQCFTFFFSERLFDDRCDRCDCGVFVFERIWIFWKLSWFLYASKNKQFMYAYVFIYNHVFYLLLIIYIYILLYYIICALGGPLPATATKRIMTFLVGPYKTSLPLLLDGAHDVTAPPKKKKRAQVIYIYINVYFYVTYFL